MDVYVMDRQLVCAVTFPRDGQNTAYWAVYDLDNKKVSYGFSKGLKGCGAACVPMAMTNAKRAARRLLKKKAVMSS